MCRTCTGRSRSCVRITNAGTGMATPMASRARTFLSRARVVAVADSFDAMTFDTPYRKALPVEKAFAELENQLGRQYDPAIVRAFLQSRAKVLEQREAFTSSKAAKLKKDIHLQ